jgi:hypothetical protein
VTSADLPARFAMNSSFPRAVCQTDLDGAELAWLIRNP